MHIHATVLSLALLSSLAAQDPEEEGREEQADAATVSVTVTAPGALAAMPGLQTARSLQDGFAAIAERVWPSIVTVRAYERVPAVDAAATEKPENGWVEDAEAKYPGYREYAALSGWVVAEDGEILTCNHGLLHKDGKTPDLIDIETNDYQRIVCERVGIEPTVNIAILQAVVWPNSHPRKLPALQWADSSTLRSGHWLIGFGDPSGPERFLQLGTFVSHPSRDCYQDLLSAFYMQVGMVAHPQAYGGPMIDLTGRVAGIIAPRQTSPGNWSGSQRFGVEFGLPSKIVKGLYEAIRHVKSFKSPWLGYAVMSRPEIAKVRGIKAYQALNKPRNGILIENVFEAGPAFQVGIEPGDWLVQFGKTRIFTPVDFQKQLYLSGIGGKVQVELWRNGETLHRELIIEERPQEATPR